GTMDEVVGKLATVHPDLPGRDADLLRRAFGQTRFIYLRRRDAVAQAVSLLRAEQTDVWFETIQGAHQEPQQEPRFDFGQLRARVGCRSGSRCLGARKGAPLHPFHVLLRDGAGEGNRTLMTRLEGWGSAIELRPRALAGGRLPPAWGTASVPVTGRYGRTDRR